MRIACKERGVIHDVDMMTQTALCGRPDRHMRATGGREITCPKCQEAAQEPVKAGALDKEVP